MNTQPEELTIEAVQLTVAEWERATGFDRESALQKCLLLGEEMGELFKAVRAATGMRIDPQSTLGELSEELADVMIFTIAIANRFDVDLGTAIREKLEKNNGRLWR